MLNFTIGNAVSEPSPIFWRGFGADAGDGEGTLQSANPPNEFLESANDGNAGVDSANQ